MCQVEFVHGFNATSDLDSKLLSYGSLCGLVFLKRLWRKLNSRCKYYGIFSQLSIIQYVGLCVLQFTHFLVMIGRIYIYMYILCLIIIIKSEVWTITQCLGLGHETMVCAVCISVFSWLLADWWRMEPRHHYPWCSSSLFWLNRALHAKNIRKLYCDYVASYKQNILGENWKCQCYE